VASGVFENQSAAIIEGYFLAADDLADGLHGALATGALERVAAPDLQDEFAPEGAHVAGGLFGRGRDEEGFRIGDLKLEI